MELWGFEKKSEITLPRFGLLQVRVGPDPRALREPEGRTLLQPGEVEITPSPTWPQNINQIEECIAPQGHLDEGSEGYIDPLRLRIDPDQMTYRGVSQREPRTNQDHITEENWDNFSITTNFGRYEEITGNQVGTRQYQPCRIGPASSAQIYLTQGHHLIRSCERMANPSLFTPIPDHEGFNSSDALRVAAHIPEGMGCFSEPRGENRLRTLSINNNSQGSLASLRPFINWLHREGGLSAQGARANVSFLGDYYRLPSWFSTYDSAADNIERGVIELLQPQLDAEAAKSFQTIITTVATVFGSFLGAYFMVPSIRATTNAAIRGFFRNIQNRVRQLTGREAITEDTSRRFFESLNPRLTNISEMARDYLRNPETWRREHPNGIDGIVIRDVVGRAEEENIEHIRRILERDRNASAWLVGPKGDGKTVTAIAFILRAARGDFGSEWQRFDFLSITKGNLEGQSNQDYNSGYQGGAERFTTALLANLQASAHAGRRIIFFADEAHNLVNAMVRRNAHGQVVDEGFAGAAKTAMASGNEISFLGTSTNLPTEFPQAVAQNPAFFDRGERIDRRARTADDIREILLLRATELTRETGVGIVVDNRPEGTHTADVIDRVVEISHQRENGLYRPRAAESLLEDLVREKASSGAGNTSISLTTQDVDTVLSEMAHQRHYRLLADNFTTAQIRLTPLEGQTLRRLLQQTYPHFNEWEEGIRGQVIEKLESIWLSETDTSIRTLYQNSGRGFEGYVADSLARSEVHNFLENYSQQFEVSQGRAVPTPTAPLPAPTTQRSPQELVAQVLRDRYTEFRDAAYDTPRRILSEGIVAQLNTRGHTTEAAITVAMRNETTLREILDTTLRQIERNDTNREAFRRIERSELERRAEEGTRRIVY